MDSKIIFFSITFLFSSGAAINITNHNSAKKNSVSANSFLATSPVLSIPSSSSPTPTNAAPASPTSAPASPNSAAPTSPTNPPRPARPIRPAAPSPRKMLSPPLPPNINTPATSPAPTGDDSTHESSVGRSLGVSAGIIVAASNLFLMLMA